MTYYNIINGLNTCCPTQGSICDNSIYDCIIRDCGRVVETEATLGGTGSQTVNVFEFTGTLLITNQWAEITRVGTLTNLTGMYATIYDGTNTVNLTLDGAVLSGAPVGSDPVDFDMVIYFEYVIMNGGSLSLV
jgi:hypothetical protein